MTSEVYQVQPGSHLDKALAYRELLNAGMTQSEALRLAGLDACTARPQSPESDATVSTVSK